MKLIICMAGFNTRFHNAGFDIPKYLLPFGEETIIHEILSQLTKNFEFSEILLVANNRDMYFKQLLKKSIAKFNARIWYVGDTKGQAHTAAHAALEFFASKEPILIHNADTIVKNRDIELISKQLEKHDAFIDVFPGTSEAYCYINAIKTQVTDISEKLNITPYASSGLYGFKDSKTFINFYQHTLPDIHQGEIFISNVLDLILQNGSVVCNELSQHEDTLVIGSPAEYAIELTRIAKHENYNT